MSEVVQEAAAPAPENPELRDTRISWRVLGFIGISLAAHTLAFLLFQVVYPQRVTIPPPSKQIALLTPSTPEHEAILRWVDAEDPALSASSSVAVPPSLFEVPYQPSFAVSRTAPRLMPEPPVRAEPAPSPIVLPLLPRSAPPGPAQSAAAPPPTVAEPGGALAGRAFHPAGPVRFQSAVPLEPAVFLVAVNGAGEIRHLFRRRSSGDPAADAAAESYVAAGKFSPAEGEALTWAPVSVTWGADVYAPAAPEKTP